MQVHCPLTHSNPAPQALEAPQRQVPSMQWSASLPQGAPEPQRHSPVEQLSALDGSHRLQSKSLPQLRGE